MVAKILWDLHHIHGPGPINYPPVIEDMMASLTIHTMSYLLLDQKVAQQYRNTAEQQLAYSAQNMSKLHDEALARAKEE
jgi:hypothetical protein